jgi:hypothetical protein
MRKFGPLLLLVLITALSGTRSDGNAGALGLSHVADPHANAWSDLFVQIKKKKNKGDTQGEHSCPPGYVVLDKPNKYGAYTKRARHSICSLKILYAIAREMAANETGALRLR